MANGFFFSYMTYCLIYLASSTTEGILTLQTLPSHQVPFCPPSPHSVGQKRVVSISIQTLSWKSAQRDPDARLYEVPNFTLNHLPFSSDELVMVCS